MSRNIFSRTALRIYKEFNENYFEELEEAVYIFRKENGLSSFQKINSKTLTDLLVQNFNYKIDKKKLGNNSKLSHLRAVVHNGENNYIFINDVCHARNYTLYLERN